MRSVFMLAVLLSGCVTSGLKPVEPDRVPDDSPKGAQPVAKLTAAEVKALGRIPEDVRQFLFPFHERATVCQFSSQAVGVTVYAADSSDVRYVVVGYNPDNCPSAEGAPIIHRHLAYVLAPNGRLLGPRVIGR